MVSAFWGEIPIWKMEDVPIGKVRLYAKSDFIFGPV
jgi:hypothetical protein